MRNATWRDASSFSSNTEQRQQQGALRRACRGVIGKGLENLESRQLLTTVIDWDLREGTGTIVADDAGNDQPGTLYGNAAWVASRGGAGADPFAVELDGSQGTSIGVADDLMPIVGGTANVSFWIKTAQTGNDNPRLAPAVLGSGENGGTADIFWGFIDASGRIGFHVPGTTPTGGKDTVKSTLPINDDAWHHVSMSRDLATGEIKIFVDGFQNDSGVANTDVRTSTVRDFGLVIQGSNPMTQLNAQLDQIRVDNTPLTAAEVGALFNPSGQAPVAPASLATGFVGARGVQLTWQPSANASYYEVYRRTGSTGDFVKLPTNATTTSYLDSGLTPTTAYQYQVRAVNPSGTSQLSNTVSATTTATAAPGAGTGLLGVYFDEDGGPGDATTNRGGDATPFNSVGRIASRLDPQINFDWGTGRPHPQIDADNFTVRWEGQLQAQYTEAYTFYKSSDDGFSMDIKIDGAWVPVYRDWDYQGMEAAPGLASEPFNLVAGQKYDIRVEQFDGGGGAGAVLRWSSLSNGTEVIPQSQLFAPTNVPAAPSNLTAAPGTATGQVTLNWSDNSTDELGFIILRSTSGAAGTFREIGRVAERTTYTDQTFPGTTYYYQVQSFAGGTSASSNTASAQPNASLTGLRVEYYRGQFNNPANPVTGAVLDTQIHPDAHHVWGDGAPSAAVGPDNFTSVWTGTLNAPETGTYTFYTQTDDGSFIWVDDQLVINNPSYVAAEVIGVPTHTNPEGGTPNGTPIQLTAGAHNIVIRHFEGGGGAQVLTGWIKPDGTKEITPASAFGVVAVTAPTAPGAAPATGVFSKKLTVNWTDSAGEQTYYLERATQANFSDAQQIAQLGANVTSYTDEGLTPGTTYYYRVRAANEGGYSAFTVTPGATGATTLVTEPIPTAPTNLKAALRPNLSAQITWTDSSANEANFILERSTNGTTFTPLATLAANTVSYTDTGLTEGTTYTYRVVAVNGENQPSAPSNVEDVVVTSNSVVAPWANQDIGAVGRAGTAAYDAEEGQYTVVGSGADIWGTADQFHYLFQQVTGDFQVTARVVGMTTPATDPWAKAGVMIREDLTAGSQHAINAVTAGNAVHMQGRDTAGGESFDNAAPAGSQNNTGWVRLVRAGQTITAYWSADGQTWVQNGTRTFTTDQLNNTVYVGLANTAHDNADLNEAVFDNFSLVAGGPTLAPTNLNASEVPGNKVVVSWRNANPVTSGFRLERSANGTTWEQVGGDLPSGTTTYVDTLTTPGTYTYRVRAFNSAGEGPNSTTDTAAVAAGQTGAPTGWTGVDIGTTAIPGGASYLDGNDSFELRGSGADIWGTADAFHYVYQPITGDATIITRVLDVSDTDVWAKAGVMFREALTPGSQHVMLVSSRANGVHMQGRETDGGESFDLTATGAPARPVWLKLERVGDTFNGYVSEDGVTWSATPAVTRVVDMDDTVYVGLAVTSHDNTEANTSFVEHVSVEAGTTPPPTDITLTGTAANDNWTLKRVGDQIQVFNGATATGAPVSTHALGSNFTLAGGDGDDVVNLDMSGGDFNLGSFTVTGSNGNDQVKMTAADGRTLTLGGLPTLGGEVLDLGTGDLRVTGATLAAVDAMVGTARNGAVRWQGPGIGTSSATPTSNTGLAPLQQDADVLVKYTYNGDVNGDGRINSDDYFRIDSGFLAQPANPTYNQGDFNFDDQINSDDYFLIDSAFLGQGAPLAASSVAATATTPTEATPVAAAVPATATPVAVEPVVTEPLVTEPVVTEPVVTEEAATATTPSTASAAVVATDTETTTKKAARKTASSSASLFSSQRIEKRGTVQRRR